VRVPLRGSICKALVEENELEPKARLRACRSLGGASCASSRVAEVQAALALPLRVITLDENSSYGFALAAWDIDACAAKVSL